MLERGIDQLPPLVTATSPESAHVAEGAWRTGSRAYRFAWLIAVLLFVASAWFGSLELRGLFAPDEGRYAEIPREMLASGDWITPRLNDLKYFEKPPLQYWMTAISFRLFGEDEWTARLPAAMAGFFAMLMVGFTGYRLWGERTAALAAAVLGGSWAYFLSGQYLTLDMTLTACLTVWLCSFLLAQTDNRSSGRNAWMVTAWLAAALAVLSKGLIGAVLPALTLFAYLLVRRETRLLKRLNPWVGGALFLLVALPWFVAVQLSNPEFFDFFFIHEHFHRFVETGHNRPGPWWYYLPVMIVGLMPWTPALVKEGLNWYHERRPRSTGFSPELFCVLWIGVIVLFFSASRSKLPAYILPALPAIALVFANRIQTRGPNSLSWSAWGTLLVGIALIGVTAFLPHLSAVAALGQDTVSQIPWFYGAACSMVLTGAGTVWALRSRRQFTAIMLLVLGTFGSWNVVFGFLHATDANFSSERLIESLTDKHKHRPFRSAQPFYSIAQFDASVPFYLGRPVTLVDTRGELSPGIDAEPQKVIPTMELFEKIWLNQKGQAYAIMRPETYSYLRNRGLPTVELRSDGHLVVISRQLENQ
jgi:4-amino-4-deoxy-L-arabinose transferase-like glycosyltransferase